MSPTFPLQGDRSCTVGKQERGGGVVGGFVAMAVINQKRNCHKLELKKAGISNLKLDVLMTGPWRQLRCCPQS